MKKRIAILIVFCVSAFCVYAFLRSRPTVDGVMADFHEAEGRAEDMLMDPLILHADLVKSRVINDIKNPEMDKRRYAIAFLGNEKILKAIPVLETILNTESEKDYFRGDALESIFRIDETKGKQLAGNHSAQQDYLGRIARGLLDGSYKPHMRTKADALIGRHY
jgi:hypothetical protein